MKKVHIFDVKPNIPKELDDLRVLAYNMHWCWDHRCQDLFKRIDPILWDNLYHNPIALLGKLSQDRYNELLEDDGFIDHLKHSLVDLEVYLHERSWFKKTYPDKSDFLIAYFSAEFGLHASMPVYSGGLGVLAGDHLKSNSDLGIPMIGVGLLYQKGYFQQYLNADGWQQEMYPVNDYSNMAVELLKDEEGQPYKIKLDFPGRSVYIQCWKVEVGRVQLYLLDTNLPENTQLDQAITDELYGGDLEKRMQQEIVLGIGGYRMLKRLGRKPTVFHMNEGHSAFLAFERIKDLMENAGLSYLEAREAASAGNIFTTHTPVPAGNDVFPAHFMQKYFTEYVQSLGIDIRSFINLGRINPDDNSEGFCMTVMAMKFANFRNAVSRLHGEVSRKMWMDMWPDTPLHEIPIDYITNGVHPATWISRDMRELLTRYIGPQWQEKPHDEELWKGVDRISDEELWRAHDRGRERLVAFVRPRLRKQLEERGASSGDLQVVEDALNPEFLTIGFARRFATYKRATLLFRDSDRLKKIITNKTRPVQFIFAGKAHPKDEPGKELIREIIHFAKDLEVRNRVVFLENYDMLVSRKMVRGVDVWLNTPRRPLEASGTSGMKVAFNGALNLSILDGWWCEGFKSNLGWAIGKGEYYKDSELQDEIESKALYEILEEELIPMFYDKSAHGVSRSWVRYMKESMKALCPQFSTNRMTFEYLQKFYLKSADDYKKLTENNFEYAKEFATWKDKVKNNWSSVSFVGVSSINGHGHVVDDSHKVSVKVQLTNLQPDDITVELFYGMLNEKREIIDGEALKLNCESQDENGMAIFSGEIPLKASGRFGFTARVLPNRDKMLSYEKGYILWEQ